MAFFKSFKNIIMIILFFSLLPLLPTVSKHFKEFYTKHFDPRTQVAVLPVKGILYDSSYYNKHLLKFFKNEDIKAILIRMECPGSAAGTGQTIFNEILTLKKKYPKPIITLVENICASGGYYIACATDSIIAPGTAIVGSIGTALPYIFQLKEFIEHYKIGYVPFKAGKYKSATNPFVDMTPEDKQLLQGMLDDSYEQFAQDVGLQRKLSLAKKDVWANGKIFSAKQAKALGLVDKLGSASTAIQIIKEKALIPEEEEILWVHPPKEDGLWGLWKTAEDNDESIYALLNKVCTFLEQRYMSTSIH